MEDQKASFEKTLADFVAIRTVSADASSKKDILSGAAFAASLLESAGLDARAVETDGNPVVFGLVTPFPDAPTVLLYNHLDVQPASPSDWRTDPFQLTVQGNKYYGRGATDDKGPAVTALFAVKQALEQKVPLNFKIVWELEEEIGSPHFEQFVSGMGSSLKADSIVVSDTIWLGPDQPAIPTGLRGLITFEMTLVTGEKDVHSGLAGGVARNPLLELAGLIEACCDPLTGHVKIPGFYDAVVPPSESELSLLQSAGFSAKDFKRAHGLNSLRPGTDFELMKRIMTEPTFEVHGLTDGYSGPGVKTVIPQSATAKISARLVPNQSAHEVFNLIKEFALAKIPDLEIMLEGAAEPYFQDPAGPYAKAASYAVKLAFGHEPVFIREGGSIGSVLTLDHYLHVPVVMLGLSLPEHGYHAPDEYFDWRQASLGMKMFLNYFEAIAKL